MKKLFIASLIGLLVAVMSNGVNLANAADNYPVKPITCLVGGEAGGGADLATRPVAEKLSKILGKNVVVVNKPGAGHSIAYGEVYKAKPDGYTIGVCTSSLITLKMQGFYPYDYNDFTPLGHYWSMSPILFASTKTKRPFTKIQDVFSFAKANPEGVTLATGAVGGAYWTTGMLVQEVTGIKFNLIPQEGTGGFVVTQVAGGHADIGISDFTAAKPQVDAGNIRPLAVVGPTRIPGKYNYIPTLKETGYDASLRSFTAFIGPPKMPKEIVEKLVKAIEKASNDEEYRNYVLSRYDTPLYMTPEEFIATCKKEGNVFEELFKKTGLYKMK
jgi:tripartite-type tricarboxylate transporter receptor subunit TctC